MANVRGKDMRLDAVSPHQIRAPRALLGSTQGRLGKGAGVSTAAVARIEAGMIETQMSTLEAVLGALERRSIEFVSSADGTIGVVMRARPDKAAGDQRTTA